MNTVALGDVTKFIRGVTFKPADLIEDGVGVMRTKNVQTLLDLNDVARIPATLIRRQEQYLCEGDTLVSSANSWNIVGKGCWIPSLPEPLVVGGFVTAMRPTSKAVDPRFLFRWFTAPNTQATLRSFSNKTTSIANLNLKLAEQMELPLPPLPEQQRIAAILDHADALRAKRRQALAHLDSLTQAIFHEMFETTTWPLDPLANRLEFLTSGSRGWARYYSTTGDKFIRIQNVKGGHLDEHDLIRVTPPDTAEARRTRVRPGDVLLSITADLGRTAVVPEHEGSAYINQHLAILRAPSLVPRYLSDYLESATGRRRVLGKNRGATKAGLNFEDIRAVPVPIVPRDLQLSYEHRVATVSQTRRVVERALAADDELLASLQSRAFRGEL